MLFLRGAQLVVRSMVLTVFDLDVTLKYRYTEMFGLPVLSGEEGAFSFSLPQLPPATSEPTLLHYYYVFFLQPPSDTLSVFLEAHSWSEEQHNKLDGA